MLYLLKVYALVAAFIFGFSGVIIVLLFFANLSRFREPFRDAAVHLASFHTKLNGLVNGRVLAMRSVVNKGGFRQ